MSCNRWDHHGERRSRLPAATPHAGHRGAGADLLGISRQLDALRAIEAGRISAALFDAVGDDWDVETRAEAALDAIGLATLGLDRPVGTLSGGETMLVALTGLRLAGTPIVLLDEPTNNLDRQARDQLRAAIGDWPGALLVVSHDVALLAEMDETVELHRGQLDVYGGGYHVYRQAVDQEQAAAVQGLRTAEQNLRRQQAQRREAETALARRQRYAHTDFVNKRKPKIVMNTRRSQAQVSAGKLRDNLDDRVETARQTVVEQQERLRDDGRVRIELPDLASRPSPAGRAPRRRRTSSRAPSASRSPAATASQDRLLETLFDPALGRRSQAWAVPLRRDRLPPQRLDGLDEDASALDNVGARLGDASGTVRARLGSDPRGRRPPPGRHAVRWRTLPVALARLLLADPPHQLLVLDGPTNNLDRPPARHWWTRWLAVPGSAAGQHTTTTCSTGSGCTPDWSWTKPGGWPAWTSGGRGAAVRRSRSAGGPPRAA